MSGVYNLADIPEDLRQYFVRAEIGLEDTPDAYVAQMVAVFREVRRVLRDDGTLWLNLGDSYAGSWGARGRGEGTNAARPDLEAKHGTDAPGRNGFDAMGIKPKDLIGIPWRVAFALQADGWFLRQDIIWHKPNPMPESVTDRCTKAHEYVFLLSKSARYFYDAEAIKEPASGTDVRPQQRRAKELAQQHGLTEAHVAAIRACGVGDAGKAQVTQDGFGKNDPSVQALADEAKAALGGYTREFLIAETRNRRSVWTVATQPYPGAHFATFPPALIEPCILAGCPRGGTVLDPFGGSGTTAGVAIRNGRNAILCELNPAYAALVDARVRSIAGETPDMFREAAE
jgi:DNA modification methylase